MRYKVVEIDANDKTLILRNNLTQGEARAILAKLRNAYGEFGLRYVMYREPKVLGCSDKPDHYAPVLL